VMLENHHGGSWCPSVENRDGRGSLSVMAAKEAKNSKEWASPPTRPMFFAMSRHRKWWVSAYRLSILLLLLVDTLAFFEVLFLLALRFVLPFGNTPCIVLVFRLLLHMLSHGRVSSLFGWWANFRHPFYFLCASISLVCLSSSSLALFGFGGFEFQFLHWRSFSFSL
jgi:hypothetical protein